MENRKKDHIELAFKSQTLADSLDKRFMYEPMLSPHPSPLPKPFQFLDKTWNYPVWVSSMTGGTKLAGKINKNLARLCGEFGMGMGLGSCRIIMDDNTYFEDFNVRDIIGKEQALYANLGINQLEISLEKNELNKIHDLVHRLQADGLIIHVNPFQEWFQPEGDRLTRPPIDIVREFVEYVDYKIIVKEVGQGMGYQSLKELLKSRIDAIEFGAFGGTNFAKVEMLRNAESDAALFEPLSRIGHDAAEMTEMANYISEHEHGIHCQNLIISGGIKSFLDGYYLTEKSIIPAVYGQASNFLKYAKESYPALKSFMEHQIKGLEIARAYLKAR